MRRRFGALEGYGITSGSPGEKGSTQDAGANLAERAGEATTAAWRSVLSRVEIDGKPAVWYIEGYQ